jgi:hypothetical protein
MRPAFAIVLSLLLLGVALLVWREARLQRELTGLRSQVQELSGQIPATGERLAAAESRISLLRTPRESPGATAQTGVTGVTPERIAALESSVRSLSEALTRISSGRLVPEYDPTLPPPPELIAETSTNKSEARSYGPEQTVGPPDVERASDSPKAWAHLKSNSGPEWLAAGFDREVEIAEVRIRESYNPGAISKVSAMANGQEYVLWEGTALTGAMLRDFVVRPPFNLRARSIVVHFDTTRVKSWAEVDAIELVGRDGSRQWASSASASTTYAQQGQLTRSTALTEW